MQTNVSLVKDRLTKHDKEWLLEIGGIKQPDCIYGAAMWNCIEYMQGLGLVNRGASVQLTKLGQEVFEELKNDREFT